MKNKFFNLNCLLLLFLFLIGFSPQSNNMFLYHVYAEEVNSALDGLNNDSFNSVIQSELSSHANPDKKNEGEINPFDSDTSKNIKASIELMTDSLSHLGKAMSGFALALSAAVVSIIGFKVINSGRGDVLTFMRQRKDIHNAIVCIFFILIIPTFVKSVLEFQPPKALLSSVESSYNGDKNISDIIAHPSSGLYKYMKEKLNPKESTDSDKNKQFLSDSKFKEDKEMKGLAKKFYELLLGVLAAITYAPLLLITSIIGSIGFYPVSLDVDMYSKDMVQLIEKFFSLSSQSNVVDLGTNVTSIIAGGLGNFTHIINILYFIFKKLAMLCLEVICYYFGIMHLLNQETEDVQQFLTRVAQGVIGMLLFPYFLEFLLDVDGVISMSILRLAGDTIPGFSMLTILPTVKDASSGFCILVLSCAMAFVVLMLAKSFFIRRIEISFLYVLSPIFFLQHMIKSSKGSVKKLLLHLSSSVFLTTVYSPLLATISLLIFMGRDKDSASGKLIYYLLILGILWFGKEVMMSIIGIFAGGSSAAGSARTQFNQGIEKFKSATNASAFLATTGALAGAKAVHSHGGIKGTAKAVGRKTMDTYKNTAAYMDKNGLPKTIGKAFGKIAGGTGGALKGAGKYALNVGESKFWETYEAAAKKYDKYTPGGAQEAVAKGRLSYDSRVARQQQAPIDYIKRKDELEEQKKRTEFEKRTYKKHADEPDKARDVIDKLDKLLSNTSGSKAFFNNIEDFLKLADKLGNSHLVSPEIKEQLNLAKTSCDEMKRLEEEKQLAIQNGDFETALKLDSTLQDKQAFFTKNSDKITRVGLEEIRQSDRIDTLRALTNATNATNSIPNDINEILIVKDIQTVNKELNNLLHNTTDETAKQKITQFINSGVVNKQTGAINQQGLVNLISDLNTTNIDKNALNSFAESTFNYNNKQAISHMNLLDALSTSKPQEVVNRVHSGYDANPQTLQKSLSILEGNCLDKNMVNNSISNIQKTYLSNGNVPNATEVSRFTADLVSKNAINKDQASMFLGSTFGCTKEDAHYIIDYNIAKNVYDNNQPVVANILNNKSITNPDEIVSNISNKLGVTEKQAQYVLEHNRSSSQTPTQSQKVVTKVHNGYNGDTQKLQTHLYSLEKNGLDKAVVNQAVSNFKTTHLSNGKAPSATDISQLTAELVSKNAISQEQASFFIGSTFGCNKDEASTVLDYTIAKNVYDTNKDIIVKEDVVSNLSNELGVTTKQVEYIIEHNNDTQYQHNISEFNKSNGAILDYINIEANHSTQLNTARKTAEDITIPKQVSILHGATSFRGSNVANNQLEALKKETNNAEVIKRIEVVQKELSTCNNNNEAEATMKQFFIQESSHTDGLNKVVLNKAAQTSLGFNNTQADIHLKSFVSKHTDTSSDVGNAYNIELANYNSNSDTNVLDYLNLTGGSNSAVYNNSAENFVNTIIKNGDKGALCLELSDMKNLSDEKGIPIKISDVETVFVNNPKGVADFIGNQSKLIRNGHQKVKELSSNIDDFKNNITINNVNAENFNKRNSYNESGDIDDYITSRTENPKKP